MGEVQETTCTNPCNDSLHINGRDRQAQATQTITQNENIKILRQNRPVDFLVARWVRALSLPKKEKKEKKMETGNPRLSKATHRTYATALHLACSAKSIRNPARRTQGLYNTRWNSLTKVTLTQIARKSGRPAREKQKKVIYNTHRRFFFVCKSNKSVFAGISDKADLVFDCPGNLAPFFRTNTGDYSK